MKKIIFVLFVIVLTAGQSHAQKMKPTEKDAKLTVSVVNATEQLQPGETVIFESARTKKIYTGVTAENGKFDILVPKGDKYNIKYKAFTSDKEYTQLDVPNNKGELLEFEVTIQFELPKKYTLDNVYFETGKADIKPASFKEINELAEYMKLKKSLVIEIAGHTDSVGTPESNLKLSQGRANAVRAYLLQKGIDASRVAARGYGDTQPIASNDTEANRKKNRRTEVRVIEE